MRVREATPGDVPAITEIYNHAVEHTTAIWNDTLVDETNRAAWLAERQGLGFPVLVAVGEDDATLGYATFGLWRPHDGYRHTVEHSVYVRPDQQGNGLGELLMRSLIEQAVVLGKHAMVASIDAANTGSIRLHEKLGFITVGTFREVGTKFGHWLDATFMQLTLPGEAEPR